MSLYLDTSLLVAALTREAATQRAQFWLGAHAVQELVVSDWVVTEFAAALSVKLRTNQLALPDRARAQTMFARLRVESLTVVPLDRGHFLAAARFAEQYALGLRAGDALHAAIAAALGATICTLDQRLAEVAVTLGVEAILV